MNLRWQSLCIVLSFSRQYKTLYIHRYINKKTWGRDTEKPEGYLVKVSLKIV